MQNARLSGSSYQVEVYFHDAEIQAYVTIVVHE
jgi:hypothetical protein